MILKKEHSNSLKLLGWKNQNSLGHYYLEFEIYLEFDSWNLRF